MSSIVEILLETSPEIMAIYGQTFIHFELIFCTLFLLILPIVPVWYTGMGLACYLLYLTLFGTVVQLVLPFVWGHLEPIFGEKLDKDIGTRKAREALTTIVGHFEKCRDFYHHTSYWIRTTGFVAAAIVFLLIAKMKYSIFIAPISVFAILFYPKLLSLEGVIAEEVKSQIRKVRSNIGSKVSGAEDVHDKPRHDASDAEKNRKQRKEDARKHEIPVDHHE